MDLPDTIMSEDQETSSDQTTTPGNDPTNQSTLSIDENNMQLINDDNNLFAMNEDHSSIVAQAVRAISEDIKTSTTTKSEKNRKSIRRRPRRAASKKATENLNKLVSLDDFAQFDKDISNENNIDVSIDTVNSTTTETNESEINAKTKTFNRKNAKANNKKNTGSRRKQKTHGDDDEDDADGDFVLLESDSDHELGNDDNLIDDDLVIDNSLQDDGEFKEEDIDLEDSQTSKKKRGRKSKIPAKAAATKKRKTTPKLKSTPRQKSILVAKNRIVRSLKDLSGARDKVERLYGIHNGRLLQLAKIKEGFETHLFDFPKSNIDLESKYYVSIEPLCAKYPITDEKLTNRETQYKQLDEESLDILFKYRKCPLDVIIGDIETSLNTGKKVEFPVFENGTRKGFVYNTGGLITDMAWLNKESNKNTQYLAVAISQHSENPADPRLEMFDREAHVSCIEIIEFNPATLQFVKLQTILHNFGDTWNLKWHEGYTSTDDLGLLTFVAQDGACKGIQIKKADAHMILECEKPSISVSLNDSNITCFDFLSPGLIVCGFKNGYVAEFDLFDATNIPSYYHKVHDSYIVSILTSYSQFESPTVASVAVDGYFHVYDTRDIYSTKCTLLRLRGNNNMPMVYSPQLSLAVYSDASNSLRCLTTKASFASHNIISRESTVISLGTAKFHPLLLTGTADGKVYVENLARKILTGIKNSSSIHKSLQLWEWEYNVQTKQYRLDSTYSTTKLSNGEINKIGIHPAGTTISATEWNETISGCKFFAFSNMAGLLTIEGLPLE